MGLLEVRDLHTYYGTTSHILHGVSLNVEWEGDVVSLIGRNGMGKTTTLRSIIGVTEARSGEILFKGMELRGKHAWDIARSGIAYVPQGRQVFTVLTVAENLRIGESKRSSGGKWNLELIFNYFPVLKVRIKHLGKELSGGEQQMLAIARGLMTNPNLLLLDEPSEGLAPILVNKVGEIIGSLSNEDIAVLLVEQNLKMAERVAKNMYVIEKGKIVYGKGIGQFIEDIDSIKEKYLTA
jgi:branched-chain amino acid transport system ATP-binding protein